MMPDFDQAVTFCISELLFNRTRDGATIEKDFYSNINAVRFIVIIFSLFPISHFSGPISP